MAIQDRTAEFRAAVSTLSKQKKRAVPPQQQRLLDGQDGSVGKPSRGEFARRAAEIGRSINATMAKLEKLASLAKRKTLFDDRPVEIAELTYVIKQDLSSINAQISSLQALSKAQQQAAGRSNEAGEHAKNVVVLLQGKLADVSVGFKEVLEVRTKNIQAGKARTENFVSSVSSRVGDASLQTSSSPLYSLSTTPQPGMSLSRRTTPQPPPSPSVLNLDPGNPFQSQPASQAQLQMLEEGQGAQSYINARGEAIEAIERTITELGGIFAQLATMVREQHDMVQRIDQDTEDTVANIEGAQAELMKYWARVSSNRMLFIKMFGVLMIFFLLWVLVSG